ncbi:MAG: glycosyltransferase family 4 protein [Bacilli bacterium]|nr:glycosyltransferase family 4 protein [Bacilli bacterium]
MKTVAIFSGYFLPHLGGIEKYTDNLAKELSKNGYRIINVSSNYQFKKQYKIEKDNILYLLLPVKKIFIGRYPIPKKNREYKEIIKCLDNETIDAIIVNTRFHLTSFIGARYGKKHNIPVFLIDHSSSYITLNSKFIDFFANIYERFLTRKIKKMVNGFYGVSARSNQWLKELNIQANGVFYNAIDESIYEKNKKYIKKSDKIVITYAGRILVEKGVVNLLEAFLKIKNNKKCILNIAGDGPILENLKEKYQYKNIQFLGKLDHENVIKLCAKTDIFVYPSMYPEGLPTSILEAGIMKCAILATDRGGTKEVINDEKYGIIIEENVEDLVKQLDYLIDHPSIMDAMKENINARIMNNFVWSETAKTVIKEIKKYKDN